MFTFGEIRAFTPQEVLRMKNEIARIDSIIAQRDAEIRSVVWNPLNYVLETQRYAMQRAEAQVAQVKKIREQLQSSLYSTIESGDTDKLSRWFSLAATIGSKSDSDVWRTNVGFSQTSEVVAAVTTETAKDVATGVKKVASAGLPLVALGIGLVLALKLSK